jgi:PAS domain S-box-containing protein
MRLFHSRSIKGRLMLISLLTTAAALLLSGVILGERELADYKQSLADQMTVQARIIGSNCAADLLFNDQKAAEDTLKALSASPHVEAAVIYSKDGEVFAVYRKNHLDPAFASSPPAEEGYHFHNGRLILYQYIMFKGNNIGSLYIKADLKGIYERMTWYFLTLLGVILAAALISLMIFSRLQRSITTPILELARLMKDISAGKGYSVRARIESQDELGLLSQGFNTMLTQIQVRDDELERQQKHLEELVAKRTATLENTKQQLQKELVEHARAEEKLRQSEELVRNILDSVDEGFIVIDRDYRILTANKAYCRLVGEAVEDIIGRPCFAVSHKISRPCYEEGEDCAVKAVFETRGSHTAVQKYEDGEGNTIYVETKAFPLRDNAGTVTVAIETITDITERRLLEEEQLKTQKLEAIGTLAGGIAHDFNNLLQGVFGYISLAKLQAAGNEEVCASLQQAEKAVDMATNLTGQLLTFSKGGKPLKKRIGLRSVIESSANFALSGSPCDCECILDKDLWSVEADEGQIGQVIQNFVLNAKQAMPLGGRIRISAANITIPGGKNVSFPSGGKFIKITVEDSGTGIRQQHLSRIFDPYFTTKQTGSGLGLATAYSIVKNHGGAIEVDSQPDKGSTFSVYLPATEGGEEITESPSFPAARPKGKILIMDDEEIVRNAVCELVTALGHQVECAADGAEAVAKFTQARDSAAPFDVVILDLTVKGGIGGEQAIRKLREIDQGVKAVVSSGYGDNPVVANYRSYGFSACLNKPYLISELRDLLSSLL